VGGVVPRRRKTAHHLGQLFSTIFVVSVISVVFMIVPDGRLLSRRWRLGIAVPIGTLAMNWVGIALLPAGAFVPGVVVELQGFSETLADVLIRARFLAMLLSISPGAVALILRMWRSTGQQHLQLRWIATGAAALAVTFRVSAVSQHINRRRRR
jgi:hypothetical protein